MSSLKSVNKTILLGRLTKDPELRVSQAGKAIAKYSLVTSESIKNQAGQWEEKPTYHNIITFGNHAEAISKYLSKGSQVYLEGKIQNRSYEDKKGQTRYLTEILTDTVIFTSANNDKNNIQNTQSQNTERKNSYMPPCDLDEEDDLPF